MAYVKTNWVDNTTPIDKNNLNKIESGIKNNDINIGEENYDNTKTYEVGDIVRYNEKIYKCITAITTAENFDISKWEQTNIVEIVQSEKSKIYELIEALSTPIVGEGENITLNDTAEKRFENFDIEGNSEQETRSGKNLLELMEGTYSDRGITAVVKNGIVTLNGTATGTSFVGINLLKNFNLITENAYRLSAFNTEVVGNSSDNLCSLRLNGEGTKETTLNKTNSNKAITGNFLLTYITIRTAQGITYNNFVIKPQLELGAGTNEWEQGGASPSPDYPSEIKTVGSNVNLFDESKAITSTKNGMTLSYSEKGLVLNGTTTDVTNFWINDLEIDLESDNYTLSSNVSLKDKGMYVLNDENGKYIFQGDFNSAQTVKLTSKKCAKYFLIQIAKGVTFNNQRLKIKLEKGTVATPWSPYGQGCINVIIDNGLETTDANYKSQIYTIPVQQPMRSIGDIRDTFIKKENKWYESHIIGTGKYNSNNIEINETGNSRIKVTLWGYDNKADCNVMCEYFKKQNARWDSKNNEINNAIYGWNANGAIGINFDKSKFSTIEEFKKWAKEIELEFYFVKQKAKLIECTEEQRKILDELNNAKTYKGVTHIYSNDDVSPNCYVEAVKDLTTLIQ